MISVWCLVSAVPHKPSQLKLKMNQKSLNDTLVTLLIHKLDNARLVNIKLMLFVVIYEIFFKRLND
jgi:hypothetical protein